jgi:hypothetical protein
LLLPEWDPNQEESSMDHTRTNTRWPIHARLVPAFAAVVAFVALAASACGSSGADLSSRSAPRQTDSSAVDNGSAGAVQTVRYGGVEFTVPADWPVYDLAADPSTCVRFDVNAVYVGHPGADMQCPATINGHAASVLVEPLDGAANLDKANIGVPGPNGLAVEVDPGAGVENQIRAALPTVGLAVTVTFEDSAASAHHILESFHLVAP